MKKSALALLIQSTLACAAWANTPADELLEEVYVTGGHDAIRALTGSAHLLEREDLEKFDYSDINAVLHQVPGVYIRQEDGYGLRPNIGLRGATSERSQKVSLMEDGILITPAPYAAPAAYYVPNISRMQALEVFKGPAAIEYGPHTIGGAVNLITRPIPDSPQGELDLTYGSDNYQKYRLFYGANSERFGYWVEGLSYRADGFKNSDAGGDTGFTRNDVNAKLLFRSAPGATVNQQLLVKLGYADEKANETYLGLTDSDFNANPLRRYAAAQNDRFDSEHRQIHLLHTVELNEDWRWYNKGYLNEFDRAWNKLDGFISGSGMDDILANPDIFAQQIAILRGEADSNGSAGQTLDITDFAREYGSHGLQTELHFNGELGGRAHDVRLGLRYHEDYVERDHRVAGFWMQSGVLVNDGIDYQPKAVNKSESEALALFVNDTVTLDDLQLTFGLRYETIDGTHTDTLNTTANRNSQNLLMPGIGAFYQWHENWGLLLGINKGFSPNSPSASDAVDAEESINYEYGVRYRNGASEAEVIGFFSDYQNLIARCRVSDSGCDAGEEFNGGDVQVAGFEVLGNHVIGLGNGLSLPLTLVYTYTESAFQTSFNSSFSQWGQVGKGDQLPYLPEHLARVQIGLESSRWRLQLAVKYTGEMRSRAGRGTIEDNALIPANTTLDLAGTYDLTPSFSVQVAADNLTDQVEAVSRHPFGVRPNQPRSLRLRALYRF